MKQLLILFALTTIMLPACKKYEDGPFISLRSREARVANIWVYDKIIKNGEDITNENTLTSKMSYYFTESGNLTLTLNLLPEPAETKGQWHFADKDETIVFTIDGFQKTTRWQILRLKENELWYRVLENDPILPNSSTNDYECHLRPE